MPTYTRPDVGFKVYDRVRKQYLSSPLGEFLSTDYRDAQYWAQKKTLKTGRAHIVYHSSFKAGAKA